MGTSDLEHPDSIEATPPGATPSGRGPEPTPLGAGDPVPLFRPDLRVARGASPGLFEVSDPRSGKRFTLYEFELAVARMLDGRRKAGEVVGSGARLGIPIDLTGLYKFVRQMWHYGFIAPAGAEPASTEGEGTWPARESWDEEARGLFESGVRLMRLGRPADAASYFEAVLDADPANAEATEMLALIAKGQSLAARPIGEAARPAGAPARRTGWRIAALAVALALAAAGMVVYLLGRSRAPDAPAKAELAALPAEPAAPPAGATPASAPQPPPPPLWRAFPVDARRHPQRAEIVSPGTGAVVWAKDADAMVKAKEKLAVVRVEAGGGARRPGLARRIAELERLAAQDPVYRDFLEKARREERRARGRVRPVPVLAPAAGLLSRAADPPTRADKGEVLARIVDPEIWLLALAVAGEPPPLDAACEVVGDETAARAPCRIVEATRDAAAERTAVVAEVSRAAAPWLGRAQSPSVRLAPAGTAPGTP